MAYAFKRLYAGATAHSSGGFKFRRLNTLSKLQPPELFAENGVLNINDPSKNATRYHVSCTPTSPSGTQETSEFYLRKNNIPYDFKTGSIHTPPAGWDLKISVYSDAYVAHGAPAIYLPSEPVELTIEMPHELRNKTFELNDTLDHIEKMMWESETANHYNFITKVYMLFEAGGVRYKRMEFVYLSTENTSPIGERYSRVVRQINYVKESTGERIVVYKDRDQYWTDDGFLDDKYRTISILHPPFGYEIAKGYFEEDGMLEFEHDMIPVAVTNGVTPFGSALDKNFTLYIQENAISVS